jgi:hypothetical protein
MALLFGIEIICNTIVIAYYARLFWEVSLDACGFSNALLFSCGLAALFCSIALLSLRDFTGQQCAGLWPRLSLAASGLVSSLRAVASDRLSLDGP